MQISIYCKDFDLTDAIKLHLELRMKAVISYIRSSDDVLFKCRLGLVSNSHNKGDLFYCEVSIVSSVKNLWY